MKEIEAWDVLHGNKCEQKSLSSLIEEMGFKKDSFMVVNRYGPELKVGDTRDQYGQLQENKYASFGANHLHPNAQHLSQQGIYDDFQMIDRQMRDFSMQSKGGAAVTGMTGSNNGVYSAMANGGNEFIITKDPEIIKQLEKQLCFVSEQLPVPLSNGGLPINSAQQMEWSKVSLTCSMVKKNRMQGIEKEPKNLKSPFRDEFGEITASYKNFRADKLNR